MSHGRAESIWSGIWRGVGLWDWSFGRDVLRVLFFAKEAIDKIMLSPFLVSLTICPFLAIDRLCDFAIGRGEQFPWCNRVIGGAGFAILVVLGVVDKFGGECDDLLLFRRWRVVSALLSQGLIRTLGANHKCFKVEADLPPFDFAFLVLDILNEIPVFALEVSLEDMHEEVGGFFPPLFELTLELPNMFVECHDVEVQVTDLCIKLCHLLANKEVR